MTHLTGLQDFRMQTSDRAMQVQSANVLHKQNSAPLMSQDIRKSQNSGNAGKKDICKSPNNLKTCTTTYKVHPMEDSGYVLNAKSDSHLPPIELFKKLSLKSESEAKDISSLRQPYLIKGLKENVPQSFKQETYDCCLDVEKQSDTLFVTNLYKIYNILLSNLYVVHFLVTSILALHV